MKVTNRILAWMLTLAMLAAAIPMATVAADTAPDGYGRSVAARMDNAEALLYVYDTIAAALDGTPDSISVYNDAYPISAQELFTVYELVLSDHPEVFWHGSQYSCSTRNGSAAALFPSYVMTGTDLSNARAALEAQVVALTADLAGKSDYEKSLLLHDRLAAASLYVQQGYHQTAYGALVQGNAVCAGYTRAYQLLLQRVGIPAWYVTGTSVNPYGETVPHAWNLVQLDGDWYYTDVTWDDQKKYTFYAYLNVTTAQIREDHTVDAKYASYLPTATATANNYFVREDMQLDTFDVDEVVRCFRDYDPPRVYVTGDKDAFIKAYPANLLDVMDKLGVPATKVQYGYHTLGREIIFQLIVDHTCIWEAESLAPTCTEDGYSVETCAYDFCHNEQNRVLLPATGEHVYDHGCDADCNACGALRQVAGHVYDDDKDTDCNECGAVREVATHTPGDVNNDGKVNVRDLGLLQQHLNGWDVTYNPAAADCNGDGKVNVRDLGLLQQYLNGWDVVLK